MIDVSTIGEGGILAAVTGAAVSAMASLYVAHINFRFTKYSEIDRRKLTLAMYDLTIFLRIYDRILDLDIYIPSYTAIERAANDSDQTKLINIYDKFDTHYGQMSNAFFAHRELFDPDLREKMEEAFNKVDEAEATQKLAETLAHRIGAVDKCLRALHEQISRKRSLLQNS